MKLYKLVVLVCLFCICPLFAMSKDATKTGPQLHLSFSAAGNVIVDLINNQEVPLRIWQDGNSWGAARWRILVIRESRIEVFFQNPQQIFTRNVPRFTEIAGGSHVAITIDPNEGNWCVSGHCRG